MIYIWITAIMLVAAFVNDVRVQKIPNTITAGGWLLGIALHGWLSGWPGLKEALLGTSLGLVPMMILYIVRAVGAGDVKLFAAIGALNGGVFVIQSLMFSLWYAAVAAIIILLWRKEGRACFARIYFVLLQLISFRSVSHWKSYSTSSHHLRFPMMWAVLPAAVTVYMNVV
ncbi:A24 family peptidase [Paenibacillus rigui]|uniref:Prepilin peptidase n=1 Tax=Paenibacillus rigui TaxID=554312 RepID=A0A229UWR9_9BACL|nr:A24 family peptidase [Paenibacillus rigui]OXM87884.1 prepilin peptidase [Paenibacillus rigui]